MHSLGTYIQRHIAVLEGQSARVVMFASDTLIQPADPF